MEDVQQPSLSSFKCALIQLHPKPLDLEHNFFQASNYIRKAASQGAKLAALPEYNLTSWVPDSPQFVALAEIAHNYIYKYQELAKELSINIVPGTIVTTCPSLLPAIDAKGAQSSKPCRVLNVSYFISSSGEILGNYMKANLWIPERTVLTSGPSSVQRNSTEPQTKPDDHHSVIQTPLGPVGLLICWDLAFPEAFRSLIRRGARLIILPTFWTTDELSSEAKHYAGPNLDRKFIQAAVTTRSFENTCAIVLCNVGGPMEEGYTGLSQVVLPLVGTAPGSFTDHEPGMRIIDVNMRTVDVAEENYRIRADLRSQDWHYGYSLENRN